MLAGLCLLMANGCLGWHSLIPVPPQSSNNYATAAVVVATGAVLYASAGGCRIAGCPTGTYCDVASERCIRVECNLKNESEVCAAGTRCNLANGTCAAF
jgi:hypothetical protein